jgi:hypothetical protein
MLKRFLGDHCPGKAFLQPRFCHAAFLRALEETNRALSAEHAKVPRFLVQLQRSIAPVFKHRDRWPSFAN